MREIDARSPQPAETRLFVPLPVRFSDVLLPRAQTFYDKAVPKDLQDDYEHALHRVWRMQGLRGEGIPISQFAESDQQHTVAGMAMAAEYLQNPRYEALQGSIDFEGVQVAFGTHDCGEIADKVGDVQIRNRTRRDEARKRLEPIAAKTAVIGQIPDPFYRSVVTGLYNDYVTDQPIPEIQMARFIDKIQGSRTIAQLTGDLLADPEIAEKMYVHFLETIPRAVPPALKLMEILPTQEERAAMRRLVNDELEMIKQFGHHKVIDQVRPQFAA